MKHLFSWFMYAWYSQLIGAKLSVPQSSKNLVWWFMHEELQQKTGLQHTTTVQYGGSCTNKHDKLTDTFIQVLSMVVCVTMNNKLSLLMLHI